MPITCDLESTIRYEKAKAQTLSKFREQVIKTYMENFSLTREEAETYYSMNFEEESNHNEKILSAWSSLADIMKFE